MVESLFLIGQISRFSEWHIVLENVLCDRRRVALESTVSSNDS